jgi:hypothetical protein
LIQSFSLLNAFTTIVSNTDSNNKKLFSFSNTYRSNALIDKSFDKGAGTSVYKNGLALGLTMDPTSGLSADITNTDYLLAKTHYDIVAKAATAAAKEVGLTSVLGDDV